MRLAILGLVWAAAFAGVAVERFVLDGDWRDEFNVEQSGPHVSYGNERFEEGMVAGIYTCLMNSLSHCERVLFGPLGLAVDQEANWLEFRAEGDTAFDHPFEEGES